MSNVFQAFRQSDADAMKMCECELVKAALPFRERMPPELVAMALLRMCRTVLRLCDTKTQAQLLPVFNAFLRGDIRAPRGESSVLWTPEGVE